MGAVCILVLVIDERVRPAWLCTTSARYEWGWVDYSSCGNFDRLPGHWRVGELSDNDLRAQMLVEWKEKV